MTSFKNSKTSASAASNITMTAVESVNLTPSSAPKISESQLAKSVRKKQKQSEKSAAEKSARAASATAAATEPDVVTSTLNQLDT
jgi:hypothetical protein